MNYKMNNENIYKFPTLTKLLYKYKNTINKEMKIEQAYRITLVALSLYEAKAISKAECDSILKIVDPDYTLRYKT